MATLMRDSIGKSAVPRQGSHKTKSVVRLVNSLIEVALSQDSDKETTYFSVFKKNGAEIDTDAVEKVLRRYSPKFSLKQSYDMLRLELVTTTLIARRVSAVLSKMDGVKSVVVYRMDSEDNTLYLSKFGWGE